MVIGYGFSFFMVLGDFLFEGSLLIYPFYVLGCVMSSDEPLDFSSGQKGEPQDMSMPISTKEISERLVRK